MLSWDSYYDECQTGILESIELAFNIKFPDSMKALYGVGDAPFIDEPENNMAVYRFSENDLSGEFGSAMYFFRSQGGSVSENIKDRKIENPCHLPNNCIEVASDGGGETLVLKFDEGKADASIWHLSPSGRLQGRTGLIFVADSFNTFLQKIEFIEE